MSGEGQQSAIAANADVMSELTGAMISFWPRQEQHRTVTDALVSIALRAHVYSDHTQDGICVYNIERGFGRTQLIVQNQIAVQDPTSTMMT